MSARLIKLLGSALASLSVSAHAITIGQFQNPAESFLDCENASSDLVVACQIAQQAINQKLAEANLYIESDGLVYRTVNTNNIRVKDSCSRRTTIKRQEFSLKLKNTASLRLSGNALSEPAVMALQLPVEAYARFDAKDEFGKKPPLASCIRYASDSYWGDGGVSVTANLFAMLSLEPKYKRGPTGEYIFALKPIFDLHASVNNVNIDNFDIHGANAFLNIWSAATSLSTDLTVTADSLLKGESVRRAFYDLGVSQLIGQSQSILLTDYALSNHGLVRETIDLLVKASAAKGANNLNNSLDGIATATKAKIAAALNLDASGYTYLVLGPDFRVRPVTDADKALVNPIPQCTTTILNTGISCNNEYWCAEAFGRTCHSLGGTTVSRGSMSCEQTICR